MALKTSAVVGARGIPQLYSHKGICQASAGLSKSSLRCATAAYRGVHRGETIEAFFSISSFARAAHERGKKRLWTRVERNKVRGSFNEPPPRRRRADLTSPRSCSTDCDREPSYLADR